MKKQNFISLDREEGKIQGVYTVEYSDEINLEEYLKEAASVVDSIFFYEDSDYKPDEIINEVFDDLGEIKYFSGDYLRSLAPGFATKIKDNYGSEAGGYLYFIQDFLGEEKFSFKKIEIDFNFDIAFGSVERKGDPFYNVL